MQQVGAYQAKTRLAELLDQVEEGHAVTITRHGRPVAMLVPPRTAGDSGNAREVINALRESRRGVSLRGITLRELIDEGRR